MPELPEVETVRRGLARLIAGRRIAGVTILHAKSFQGTDADLAEVVGARVAGVRRHAKVLVIDLDSDHSLVVHLKMTGQLVLRDEAGAEPDWGAGHPTASFLHRLPDRSTKVVFELGPAPGVDGADRTSDAGPDWPDRTSDAGPPGESVKPDPPNTAGGSRVGGVHPGDGPAEPVTAHLFFNDQRIFGWIKVVPTDEVEQLDFITKLGPEPLDETGRPLEPGADARATAEFIRRARRHPKAKIKAVILDQTIVAGIGNIYADEALWAAAIHPATPLGDLTDDQLLEVFHEAAEAMLRSLSAGGSTMRNYFQADGKPGNYLEAFANVFGRQGEPCPRCGAAIEKTRVAGRGTHLCPRCQVAAA